jgi:hypothetical protein
MEAFSTASTKLALAVLLAVFGGEVWLAAVLPVTPAEALAYDRFVRPALRESLHQPSLNRDILYTILEKRSAGLFRVSEFSIRLPALLAGGFYLWALWRLCRVGQTSWSVPGMLLLAIAPLAWQCFSTANGLGLALALAVWALESVPKKLNCAGICLGLAVAAHLAFAIPAGLIAAIIAWRNWSCSRAVEAFLIPAVVASFIFLVLPLALAPDAPASPPHLTPAEVRGVRAAVEALRKKCGTKPIRVGSSAAVTPVLSFYRSRFRLVSWQLSDATADYYMLPEAAAGQLVVLHRDDGIVLARQGLR